MADIRFGVVGFGNIGTTHAKNVYEGKVQGMSLSAICESAKNNGMEIII